MPCQRELGLRTDFVFESWFMIRTFYLSSCPEGYWLYIPNLGVGWELYTPHPTFAGIPPALQLKELCSYCQQINI